MQLPFVTIYLITYNQRDRVMSTLQGLLFQDYDISRYEVVVLDDGSDDGTNLSIRQFAAQSHVSIKLISVSHEADYLSAKRWNQCIANANKETTIFVQLDDVLIRTDLIRQHVKWHIQGTDYLVTGAKFEGASPTWELAACRRGSLASNGRATEVKAFTAVWGASLSFTRHKMDQVFDPPYDVPYDERMSGWGYHEVEFALRMKKAGCRLIYDPSAGVFHYDHTPDNEMLRGLNREQLQIRGIDSNTAYLLRKHGLTQLPRW